MIAPPGVRALITASAWAAIGCVLVLAAITSLPWLTGHKAFNVLSGSMEPTLKVGSVVLDTPISPLDARPGDIITFADPQDADRLITHRLRAVTISGGRVAIGATKGDVNDVSERWSVAAGGTLGRVAYHLPGLGYARLWLVGNGGRLLALLALLAWGVVSVVDIWCDRRPSAASGGPA